MIAAQVETKGFGAPAIAIIGNVVDLHETLSTADPHSWVNRILDVVSSEVIF